MLKLSSLKPVAIAILALAEMSFGQQTIFNVPSVDVLDRGQVYSEFDAGFKFNSQEALGKFSSFVPRVVAGMGRNIEVGMNLTGNFQPGSDTTTLVPTIKWR